MRLERNCRNPFKMTLHYASSLSLFMSSLLVASTLLWNPVRADNHVEPATFKEEQGELVVVLLNVTNEMAPFVVEEYERDVSTFMLRHFQQNSGWGGVIKSWSAELTDQKLLVENRRHQRRLGQQNLGRQTQERRSTKRVAPLVTRTIVTAEVSVSPSSMNFVTLLQEVVDEREAEFIALLKESESMVSTVFFKPVASFETFAPAEEITTKAATFDDEEDDSDETQGGDDDDGLSTRTIAGIAAAAGFVTILIVGILCVSCRNDDDDDEDDDEKKDEFDNNNTQQSRGLNDSVSNGSGVASSRYRSRNLGRMRSSSTRIVSSDGTTLSVLDNSHSFVKDEQPEAAPARDSTMNGDGQPVFEDEGGEEEEEAYIEQDEQAHNQGDASHQGLSTQPDFSMGDSIVQQEAQAMHEENEAAAADSAPQTQEDKAEAVTTRQVVAPPGKLGIVIETTLEGPVVHKVNDGSPLKGKVFEGELITAIDDVDTRAMSASAITNLMIRTADSHRTMTVRSNA